MDMGEFLLKEIVFLVVHESIGCEYEICQKDVKHDWTNHVGIVEISGSGNLDKVSFIRSLHIQLY